MPRLPITRASGRYFLTDRIREKVRWGRTPQARGYDSPPVQKPVSEDASTISLPAKEQWHIPPCDLIDAIGRRKSRRRFLPAPLSLEEVAFLLWSTQGVRAVINESTVFRAVPSAGCRHPFETYLVSQRVEGLSPGVYRYLPLDRALVFVRSVEDLKAALLETTLGQRFAAQAAVTFIWSVIPARTEWRYAEASYKVIAVDAGHVCQNLYLACEAIGAGTCAIAAYDQDAADALIGLDGVEEFAVYIAPVGKVDSEGAKAAEP